MVVECQESCSIFLLLCKMKKKIVRICYVFVLILASSYMFKIFNSTAVGPPYLCELFLKKILDLLT